MKQQKSETWDIECPSWLRRLDGGSEKEATTGFRLLFFIGYCNTAVGSGSGVESSNFKLWYSIRTSVWLKQQKWKECFDTTHSRKSRVLGSAHHCCCQDTSWFEGKKKTRIFWLKNVSVTILNNHPLTLVNSPLRCHLLLKIAPNKATIAVCWSHAS